jgi:hypothetical protein
MITYENLKNGDVKVFLDRKHVGKIACVDGGKSGFQYFPKGCKDGGEVLPTIFAVKQSLENPVD